MTLLSNTAIATIQRIGNSGLISTGRIYDLTDTQTATGSESTWVARTDTVKCWLHSTPTPVMTIISGIQAIVNTYRLFLPVGTDIETGDRFELDNKMFTVSDTTGESTYQAVLVVSLRRVE